MWGRKIGEGEPTSGVAFVSGFTVLPVSRPTSLLPSLPFNLFKPTNSVQKPWLLNDCNVLSREIFSVWCWGIEDP